MKRSGGGGSEEGEEVRGSGGVKGENCVQFHFGEEGEREGRQEK